MNWLVPDVRLAGIENPAKSSTRPPLWQCPACAFRTRSIDAAVKHAELPDARYLGPHTMFHPGGLDWPAIPHEQLLSIAAKRSLEETPA